MIGLILFGLDLDSHLIQIVLPAPLIGIDLRLGITTYIGLIAMYVNGLTLIHENDNEN